MRTTAVLVAMWITTIAGCAGQSAWTSQSGDRSVADANRAAVSPTGSASSAPLKISGRFHEAPDDSGWGQSIQTATRQVADALTIHPRVVPASDPLSLSGESKTLAADVFVTAARHLENSGRLAAAERQYLKALEMHPQSAALLISLARLYDRQANFEQATAVYQRATVAAPDSALACNDLGLCFARQGNLPESITALRKAAELQPQEKRYRNNLATVLVESNQLAEAYHHLSSVHGEAVAHYNLGYLLQQKGATAAAVREFDLALQMNPGLAAAREMLARLAPVAPQVAQAAEPRGPQTPLPGQLPSRYPPIAIHPSGHAVPTMPAGPRLLPPIE